ncbi:MAG TPA: regulatory protein GemA [Gammaproteobacteria bacterium]|nr:regulatory protein GemA [Gammaproteobacteria bacterium]
MTPQTDSRRRDLAKIHLAAKQLGMDDETYRDMLWTVARVRSAGDLDQHGRRAVLEHLRAVGWAPSARSKRPRVSADRAGMVSKIDAMLAEAGRRREYADGMARRMFRVERVEWCHPGQLRRIVAALTYDQKRRQRR